MVQVQTFEQTEVNAVGETEKLDAEAIELSERLGLTGQRSLVSTGEVKTLCPYRVMTKEERVVYEMLCPEKQKVENYDKGPIPLRVLQVLAHAKELGIFTGFKVWHATIGDDPILVAYKEEHSSATWFLLARWGEVLEDFAVLGQRALAQWKPQVEARLREIQSQVTGHLATVQHRTLKDMVDCVGFPNYYGH